MKAGVFMNEQFERLAKYLSSPKMKLPKNPGSVSNELWIKVDFDYVLVRGIKIKVRHAVIEKDDTVYLPLAPFCLYSGAGFSAEEKNFKITLADKTYKMTLGEKKWSEKTALRHAPIMVGDAYYIDISAIKRIFGLKRFYNYQIGLLIFSDKPMYYDTGYNSLVGQIHSLADLIFDTPTGERVYNDIIKNGKYGVHPRLTVGAEAYDELYALYLNECPETEAQKTRRAWILRSINEWEGYFNNYFAAAENGETVIKDENARLALRQPYYIYDENGKRLVGVKEYTYINDKGESITEKCSGSGYGDGYDYGGRSSCRSTWLMYGMARLYRMTHEKKYKEAVWLLAKAAAECEHWGEGHFLDCAGAMKSCAMAIDLMWREFEGEPEKLRFMLDTLYKKGLYAGAVCIRGEQDKVHISTINYASWKTVHRRPNNWNSVCSSGLIAAAVLLMEIPEYRNEAIFVVEKMLSGTKLCVHQYAPDGAYIESPSYWSYGTSEYIGEIAILKGAVGETYGYLNTVGLKESFEFASNICNPEGYTWGFHDGGYRRMEADFLYQAAYLFDDPALALLRNRLIECGASAGFWDALYWRDYSGAKAEPALDYRSIGIETVTFRDSWNRDDYIFTGLHAGANWALHGDSDSGNFYLEMGGVTWFSDPGSENYNVGGYWGDMPRYRYYNKSLEAHNLMLIKSEECPRGQVFNRPTDPCAKILRYETANSGALAVADMKAQYGSSCTFAARGLWLTENRSIVVLQDEISFDKATDLIWIATPESYDGTHPDRARNERGEGGVLPPSDVTFSSDGRTAFIKRLDKHGKEKTLRATIISDNADLHFELIPADTTVFEETITGKNSGNKYAAEAPARIAIFANGVRSFDLAVVFDLSDAGAPVSYEYEPMEKWQNK